MSLFLSGLQAPTGQGPMRLGQSLIVGVPEQKTGVARIGVLESSGRPARTVR